MDKNQKTIELLNTKEITEELCRREGVEEIVIDAHAKFRIEVVGKAPRDFEGPARLLIITD
ncbi:BC1881 family protein [Paenibacillus sp. FSL H7-0714]|uniref:BC1881 family protein n=1 Tax=Paenibacillus sp. FSL H7-0714 TaxID=2954735 RepID=UPI0030FC6513